MKRLLVMLFIVVSGCLFGSSGQVLAATSVPVGTKYTQILKNAAASSPYVSIVRFGRTAQGRRLEAAIVSAVSNPSPEAAASSHKMVIFVLCGLQVGDVSAEGAALRWLTSIASSASIPKWMQSSVVVLVPLLNVDGVARLTKSGHLSVTDAETAPYQGTPGLVDLDTDFLYARSSAMRAWLRLVNNWHPGAYVLLRTNLLQPPGQYDVTWAMPPLRGYSTSVAKWLKGEFGGLGRVFHKKNLSAALCYQADRLAVLQSGLHGCLPSIGSLGQLAMLLNRPEISLTLPRTQGYQLASKNGMEALSVVLKTFASHSRSLRIALTEADQHPLNGETGFPLNFEFTSAGPARRFEGYQYSTVLSPISGSVWARYRSQDKKTYFLPWARHAHVKTELSPWATYAVPGSWKDIIRLLRVHGILTKSLQRRREMKADVFHLDGYGAHAPTAVNSSPNEETISLPASTVIVPGHQAKEKLVAALLLPSSPESVLAEGLLGNLLSVHVNVPNAALERRAGKVLASDARLARQFAERVADDPKFANDPERRLEFFLQRYDASYPLIGVYPIFKLLDEAN